jgi:hypothetical protein
MNNNNNNEWRHGMASTPVDGIKAKAEEVGWLGRSSSGLYLRSIVQFVLRTFHQFHPSIHPSFFFFFLFPGPSWPFVVLTLIAS